MVMIGERKSGIGVSVLPFILLASMQKGTAALGK